jgi:hypothetical protein
VSHSGWFNTEPIVEEVYASRAQFRRRLSYAIAGVSFLVLVFLIPLLIPERPQRPLPPIVVPASIAAHAGHRL